MLCTNLVLVKMKTSVMMHRGMQDYSLCDIRAQVKIITAMEVVG